MPEAHVAWWRDFFDEDYAFLYGEALTPERTEREVAAVVSILGLREGHTVLDLCCADGRHAVPLERRGLRVTAVDASVPLLFRAARRAERVLGAGGEASARPPWPVLVQADVRALPLRPASFDAALLLFSSIGYGTDADTEAMFSAARKALAPSGQLLVECAHRDLHVARAGPMLVSRDWTEIGGVRVLTERRLDPIEGVEEAVFRYQRGEVELVKRFRHRLYTPTELLPMLRRAGFGELRVWGDYDRRPFTSDAPFLLVRGRAA